MHGNASREKEVCGEANWETRTKGTKDHAKTTVQCDMVCIQPIYHKG